MYAWYEKTTHMCCAFFYDITQIFLYCTGRAGKADYRGG